MLQDLTDLLTTPATAELVPRDWLPNLSSGQLIFNPTLVERPGGYAMCYRVVPPDTSFRGIATCLLSQDFQVVEGSVTPLSDFIRFSSAERLDDRALRWHADPRYHRLGSKLYLTWNDGANRPRNHQFLLEMENDGLRPAGLARELVLCGLERRDIEKNWMLFEYEGDVFVVYSCSPHIILRAELSDPAEVRCYPAAVSNWHDEYSAVFGVMRGGAQPVRRLSSNGDDVFLSITHSSYKTDQGRQYEVSAYEFEARMPFRVLRSFRKPLDMSTVRRSTFVYPRLNPQVSSVIYPCGFVIDKDKATISCGINDEDLAITRVPISTIERDLKKVVESGPSFYSVPAAAQRSQDKTPSSIHTPTGLPKIAPLFWWDAAGKKFDGNLGSRRFKVGNFGDIASKDIFERVGGCRAINASGSDRKVVSIGSVLHKASNGDVIWGTGIKGTVRTLPEEVKELDIRAVRGPLTLEFLRERGFDVGKVSEVFDPGCLVKQVFRSEIEAYDVAKNSELGSYRIVPHYRDDLIFRRLYSEHVHSFLPVDCSPQQMIEGMLGAEAVFSSSLHGVIFAESLGIPAYWLRSVGGEDGYKFYDYYYGTGRYQVKCFETLHEAITAKHMPLPSFQPDAYLATFPHDLLVGWADQLGLVPAPGVDLHLGGPKLDAIHSCLSFAPESGYAGSAGFWFVGKTSACSLRLSLPHDRTCTLELTLRPFNSAQLPAPQEIHFTVAGQRYHLKWPKGVTESISISLPVAASALNAGWLHLQADASQAFSMAALGVGRQKERLTVCIERIRVLA